MNLHSGPNNYFTIPAVHPKLDKKNITRKRFTKDETDFIIENYNSMSIHEICLNLKSERERVISKINGLFHKGLLQRLDKPIRVSYSHAEPFVQTFFPKREQAPIEQAPIEQAPIEQAPIEQAPIEQAPIEQAPVEQAPVEQAPVEEYTGQHLKIKVDELIVKDLFKIMNFLTLIGVHFEVR